MENEQVGTQWALDLFPLEVIDVNLFWDYQVDIIGLPREYNRPFRWYFVLRLPC